MKYIKNQPHYFHFTIDVDYYPGSEKNLINLYNFCDKKGLRPTLFVSGMFAVKYPHLITEAIKRGYEIGTHGWMHCVNQNENFQSASYEKQKKWILLATEAIKKITKLRPKMFRAPNLNISTNTFKVLKEQGYLLDSSIPSRRIGLGHGQIKKFKQFLAPLEPYYPSDKNLTKKGGNSILEVPPSSFFCPINMSALRTLGLPILKWTVKQLFKKTNILVFYLHPIEFVNTAKLQLKKEPRRYRNGLGPQNFKLLSDFVKFIIDLNYLPKFLGKNIYEKRLNNNKK